LVVLYFGVLAWVIFLLNRLHRRRKRAQPSTPAIVAPGAEIAAPVMAISAADPAIETPEAAVAEPAVKPTPERDRRMTVVSVDGPDPDAGLATIEPAPARLAFGLTGSQLMVILVVFIAAIKAFTWALANLRAGVR